MPSGRWTWHARQVNRHTNLTLSRMLAHVNNLTGRHSAAEHIARQGIDLASEQNYIADRAYFIATLGDACHGLGRYQDAIAAFEQALPPFREHGLRQTRSALPAEDSRIPPRPRQHQPGQAIPRAMPARVYRSPAPRVYPARAESDGTMHRGFMIRALIGGQCRTSADHSPNSSHRPRATCAT